MPGRRQKRQSGKATQKAVSAANLPIRDASSRKDGKSAGDFAAESASASTSTGKRTRREAGSQLTEPDPKQQQQSASPPHEEKPASAWNRCVEFVEKTINPILNLPQEPYFDPDLLEKYRISVVSMDFETGALPDDKEQFLKPLSRSEIGRTLDKERSEPGSDYDFTEYDFDLEINNLSLTWHDAFRLGKHLESMLRHPCPDYRTTLTTGLTRWMWHLNTERWLHRHSEDGHKWQAGEFIRFCTLEAVKNSDMWTYYHKGFSGLDPTIPHIQFFVQDGVELKDDRLSTGEVHAIVVASAVVAAENRYIAHEIIPVTIISGYSRSVRIVQGIVDFKELTVDIRKTKIVDFKHRLQQPAENWENCKTVLGWMVGEPVGVTTRSQERA